MTEEIRIGPAAVAEWDKFKALRLEALQADPQAFGSSYETEVVESDEEWQEIIQNASVPNSNVLLFARAADEFVGMIGAFIRSAPKTRHIATIWGVYVSRHYRGRGIGKQLMAAVLDELSQRPEILKVKLTVNTEQLAAVKLYESFGFKIIGRAEKELRVADTFYDEFYMEKIL